MVKFPTVQTAFCGNPIYASCICMAWTYLIIDVIMFAASVVLLILTVINFVMRGEKAMAYTNTDANWMSQISELSLSYALTNVVMCVNWLFTRAGLLLGLHKESVSVLTFWCCLSAAMMLLQLCLCAALAMLLMASTHMSDVAFLLGSALVVVQLVVYVDCHLYLTLVAHSVKEAVRRRLLAAPTRLAKAKRAFSVAPTPTRAPSRVGANALDVKQRI